MNLVVDCSYIMSLILPDENQTIDPITLYKLHAPSVFYLECNNVIMNALKKNRIGEVDYKEYLEIIQNLPINIDKFCSRAESFSFISRLALSNKLTSYDASYLELALRLDSKIATLDKNLRSACQANNIKFL